MQPSVLFNNFQLTMWCAVPVLSFFIADPSAWVYTLYAVLSFILVDASALKPCGCTECVLSFFKVDLHNSSCGWVYNTHIVLAHCLMFVLWVYQTLVALL